LFTIHGTTWFVGVPEKTKVIPESLTYISFDIKDTVSFGNFTKPIRHTISAEKVLDSSNFLAANAEQTTNY